MYISFSNKPDFKYISDEILHLFWAISQQTVLLIWVCFKSAMFFVRIHVAILFVIHLTCFITKG